LRAGHYNQRSLKMMFDRYLGVKKNKGRASARPRHDSRCTPSTKIYTGQEAFYLARPARPKRAIVHNPNSFTARSRAMQQMRLPSSAAAHCFGIMEE
jgi:hypothetical protein